MTRLKAFVDNPVEKSGDVRPFYALEQIEPRLGRLTPGTEAEERLDQTAVQHRPGDVRFGKLRPYLAKSLYMTDHGHGSGELLVIRPRSGSMHGRFLHYLTLSKPFVEWATATSYGVKMPRTSWEALSSFPVDPPSPEEQQRVADYLDTETARIDELIAELQGQRELVEERYRARLVHAVLSGVAGEKCRPSPELQGASVPTSWQIRRLGNLNCEIQTGPFGSQLHQHDYVDSGYPVVNPANLVGGQIQAIDGMAVDEATRRRLSRHILQPGDVVFGRRGEMGRAGLVTEKETGWLCGTGSLRIRFREPVFVPAYLKRVLEASIIKQHLEASSVGTTMDNLNATIVGRVPVPVPPLRAQQQIAELLAEYEVEIGLLSEELNRQIDLLQERRHALITHAVTQGIDGLPGVA